jgi:hypothetical protein
MPVMEVISGRIANVATLTNLTTSTGDSLTIRSFNDQKRAWLLNTWALVTAAGITEIHSARMHDNQHGYRARVAASQPQPLMPFQGPQRIYPVDTLVVQLAGDATAGRIQPQSLMLYYESVDGLNANLISPKQLADRMLNTISTEVTVTLAVTGDYSAAVALSSGTSLLKANTYYALLGFIPDIACASVHLRGIDVGNVRVGAPGLNNLVHLTSSWFVRYSDEWGVPLIPVLNSQNQGSIQIDALMSQAGGTLNLGLVLAELKPQ